MEAPSIDLDDPQALSGFRLHTLEVYNWGTFHKKVWRLELNNKNTLLTGDIGSGKSTLVDAVTTLLVPASRIAYNKAAGAEIRERSLTSYVLGFFKSERSDAGHASKAVPLRDHNTFSVILGVFKNEGFGEEVTLAQVFWIKDTQGRPDRFYLLADGALSITRHFSGFGPDIGNLKKRLKKIPGVEIFETFPRYGAGFRRRFGIENEQALNLFHQTVSMKSVGNLTDFVREHMLEAFDVNSRIEALIHHFDDLNRAHEAVVKAKDQVERLTPLIADCDHHASLSSVRDDLKACREALIPFFSLHKKGLLRRRLDGLTQEHERVSKKIESLERKRRDLLVERDDLKRAISENGGDRIERVRSDMERYRLEKERRMKQAERYEGLRRSLEFPAVSSQELFEANLITIRKERVIIEKEEAEIQNRRTDHEVRFRELRTAHETLCQELSSLLERKNNIHAGQIRIRNEILSHLNLSEEVMPFAGELIQVREGEEAWEGAAERLLNSFGLSLLVPESHYHKVSLFVDQNRLKGRLVYYLVRMGGKEPLSPLHPDSMVNKLSVKPDSVFYSWIEKELAQRFNYACCSDLHQFNREPQAITKKGQTKSGGKRHEKDDRRDIFDRSSYILGWSNEQKIKILRKNSKEIEGEMQAAATCIAGFDKRKQELQKRLTALIQLGEFLDFADLDWQSLAREISRLDEEKKELEQSSEVLKTLESQLLATEKEIALQEKALEQVRDVRSKNEERQRITRIGIRECDGEIAGMEMANSGKKEIFRKLETMRVQTFEKQSLTVESCQSAEKEMRKFLQGRIEKNDREIRSLEERIIRAMHGYRRDYPLETSEVDDSVASAPEYGKMLEKLKEDNLPRFEKRFKDLLNENTIREVANFQSQLLRERESIRERIGLINHSLKEIEYNPGRYIVLETQLNSDNDIKDFQGQLRACTEGSLTGSDDDHYSETKFLQVRQVIDRFRGREGMSDMDQRWTRKVTDVRNWFLFAASERWREDNAEYEHYTDSGGKSGGQKEKLAYTVLAASLAYQFGLEWGASRSRSFRFVAIDEAFGRGSDESTRFSLALFQKMNLQLLIVTPLQKIHTIEPFVSSVGLVYSKEGQISQLRNMTVEEYRTERMAVPS